MARYVMVIDLSRCVGCNACAAACAAENLLSPTYFEEPPLLKALVESGREEAVERSSRLFEERTWLRTSVSRIYSGKYPNVSLLLYHNICRHCENPPCAAVCPTGATYVRDDGIVAVDHSKCILCGYCVAACPYAARHVNPYTRTVDKCTFCMHRIDEGKLPACVETCPAHARIFGDLDDPNSEVSRLVEEGAIPGTPQGPLAYTRPRVYFVQQQPRERRD